MRVFNWTGKNDYVALCEPESISFGGGCVPAGLVLARTPVLVIDRAIAPFTGMDITGCTSTKRSTKGRLRAAPRSTTIRSALRTRDRVAPPRSSASVSRFGV